MPLEPQHINLRNVLAGIYWNRDRAYEIVVRAQINVGLVDFNGSPVLMWTSILERAQYEGRLDEVIAAALSDNPKVPELVLAAQGQLHYAVTPPTLDDSLWKGPSDESTLEEIMGKHSTLRPISFLQRGLQVARSVGRVVRADGNRGSGFLILKNLLITNHHVLPSLEKSQGAVVEFNYEKTIEGVNAPIASFPLEPERCFLTSPVNGGDDWSIVQVSGTPNEKWGAITVSQQNPAQADEVIIIQHPGGGSKQIALSHNQVVYVNDRHIQYLTDTLEGSSGSPVFDVEWQLVGLHHKGGWIKEPKTNKSVYRNQGIHVNLLVAALQKAGLAN